MTDENTTTPPGGSMLDQLKRQREKIAEPRTLELDVPGYNRLLVAVMGPIRWEDLKAIGVRNEQSRDERKELHAQAETLAKACLGIYVREEVGAELKSIDPNGETVRFDDTLTDLLDGPKLKRARDVVLWLFNDDVAVTAAHAIYSQWRVETQPDEDEDLLGN